MFNEFALKYHDFAHSKEVNLLCESIENTQFSDAAAIATIVGIVIESESKRKREIAIDKKKQDRNKLVQVLTFVHMPFVTWPSHSFVRRQYIFDSAHAYCAHVHNTHKHTNTLQVLSLRQI